MKNERLKLTTLLILTMVLLSLVMLPALSCGTGPTQPTPQAPATPQSPTPAQSPPTAVQPVRGGILKILADRDIPPFGDPAKLLNPPYVLGATLETLLKYDEKGNFVPLLATSWQLDSAAKTITFILRKGVKFHDGTDFNADAVKWNLSNYKDVSGRSELAQLVSVDVIDPHTARLNFSEWNTLVLSFLAIHTGGLMISPTAYQKNGADWAKSNPIGTGPFKLVEWKPDVRQVYQRFDGYWQEGKPYLDGFEVSFITDPTARNTTFLAGEADINLQVTPAQTVNLKEQKFTLSSMYFAPYGVVGNSTDPASPFADIRVRQAMTHAINTEQIAATFGYGYTPAINQFAIPGTPSHNPNVIGYPYNPEKAKQLLAEAGYANGFSTTITSSTQTPGQAVAEAIAGYLKVVGINAEVVIAASGQWTEYVRNGTTGIMGYAGQFYPEPVATMFRQYTANTQFKNIIRPVSLSDTLKAMAAAPDLAAKNQLTQKAQKIMVDEFAMVTFLYASQYIAVRSPKVHDDKVYQSGPYANNFADCWLSK